MARSSRSQNALRRLMQGQDVFPIQDIIPIADDFIQCYIYYDAGTAPKQEQIDRLLVNSRELFKPLLTALNSDGYGYDKLQGGTFLKKFEETFLVATPNQTHDEIVALFHQIYLDIEELSRQGSNAVPKVKATYEILDTVSERAIILIQEEADKVMKKIAPQSAPGF